MHGRRALTRHAAAAASPRRRACSAGRDEVAATVAGGPAGDVEFGARLWRARPGAALTRNPAAAASLTRGARTAAVRDEVAAAIARRSACDVLRGAGQGRAPGVAAALAGRPATAARLRRGARPAARDDSSASVAGRSAREVLLRARLGRARARGRCAALAGDSAAAAGLPRGTRIAIGREPTASVALLPARARRIRGARQRYAHRRGRATHARSASPAAGLSDGARAIGREPAATVTLLAA
jgi:hypothetical protein